MKATTPKLILFIMAVLKLSYENGIPVKAEISLKNRIEADSVTASRLAC